MRPHERVSYAIRMVLSHLLYYTGGLHLLLRHRLKDKVVVLMYHRVLTPEQRTRTASQPGLVVGVATFARQMAVLKRLFTVLTLDEFTDRLEGRIPFQGPCCLITFDDGWIDNLQNALPVLCEHGLPSVIFLPVNFIGSGRLFTREALTHLLVQAADAGRADAARRERLRAQLVPFRLEGILDTGAGELLAAAVTALRAHRYASAPEFEALAAGLRLELGVTDAQLSQLDTFIGWADVELMARQQVAFGGHGTDHRILSQVPPEVARFEVETSKDTLDARLAAPATAFAYPNGVWNSAVKETVKASGYRLAFTIDPGAVARGDDQFTLRRVNIHEDMTKTTPMFLARLSGLF